MIVLGWVCLVSALLPAVITLVNLPFFSAPQAAEGRPHVSVLIPARDEEANIAAIVTSVLASTGVALELIVLDDHSIDQTRSILSGITDPRLRVIEGTALPAGWSGKQHACAMLARAAACPLLVFVDADVRLAPDAIARMAGHLAHHPSLALASGFPRQITRTWSELLLLPLIHMLLLGYLPIPLAMLSRAPALAAGCGQLFIARADAYHAAGGHAAIRASRHDGIMLPRTFRRAGLMTGLFDATELASCRMYTSAGALWEGLTKNATEGMATPVALPLWTLLLGLGQMLPVPLAVLTGSGPVIAAAVTCLGIRAVLAVRFDQRLVGILFHPLSVAALLTVQWAALFRQFRGRPSTWKGRTY